MLKEEGIKQKHPTWVAFSTSVATVKRPGEGIKRLQKASFQYMQSTPNYYLMTLGMLAIKNKSETKTKYT